MAEMKRKEYHKNKDKYLERSRKARVKKRQWMYDYLLDHPCEICGENRPECLDFDHIDKENKSFNISKYRDSKSYKDLENEINKCRVLCANCHRIHTAVQMGWYIDIDRRTKDG
jgi:hypothetical protein